MRPIQSEITGTEDADRATPVGALSECWRRFLFDPARRFCFDPGVGADDVMVGCG